MYDSVYWIDDVAVDPPGGLNYGQPDKDGTAYLATLASHIESDVERLAQDLERDPEGCGEFGPHDLVNPVLIEALRGLAQRVRASGCKTVEAWRAHQGRPSRRGRFRRR